MVGRSLKVGKLCSVCGRFDRQCQCHFTLKRILMYYFQALCRVIYNEETVDINDSRSLSRYERGASENESSEIVFAPREDPEANG